MVTITTLSAADMAQSEIALAELLCDAVNNGASVNFVAPLALDDARAYWQTVTASVERGDRLVIAAWRDGALVGTTQLVFAHQANGRHRAEVQKVLVHTSQRRRGIGRALMEAIEAEARQHGRTLLVLDTERDSSGDQLYRQVGYTCAGIIPNFALTADSSRLIDTVLYYKQL